MSAPGRCRLRRILPVLLLAGLGGCSDLLPDWLGQSEAPPLPGERISVLSLEQALEPDPRIADLEVRLPRPWRNEAWPQAGGYSANVMHHLELPDSLSQAWRASIGSGSSGGQRLLAPPIVAEGRVFVLDAASNAAAFDVGTGRRLWRVGLVAEKEEAGALGGGLAFEEGRLFATTAYGQVFALEPETGAQLWQRRVGVPFRGPPTVGGGRVFAISFDNQLHVLSAADGQVQWTHSGLPEDAGLIGGASPAYDGGVVVVPYSSGELFALRADNGRVLWSDQLVRTARGTQLADLSDIRGRPILDRGRVFAISHSGRLAAIDLRTGERLWERDIAGLETPWVAGDFIYLVTLDAEVVCLYRRDGRVRWVRTLDRFESPRSKSRPIHWSGPLLAGDRLVLVSSHGQALSLSPYSGEVIGRMNLPDGAAIAPVVADGTLFILTDGGRLLALR
ncbi:MAG: pyrrolo-quinoline quinone [Alphaproteobacteria bacterium]|nr:pyrrolo-quinoline quinone [Alphaproteobacteria bacterium]